MGESGEVGARLERADRSVEEAVAGAEHGLWGELVCQTDARQPRDPHSTPEIPVIAIGEVQAAVHLEAGQRDLRNLRALRIVGDGGGRNRIRLIGQKRPFKPKDVWAIRARLQLERRARDLALFNLAIDSNSGAAISFG